MSTTDMDRNQSSVRLEWNTCRQNNQCRRRCPTTSCTGLGHKPCTRPHPAQCSQRGTCSPSEPHCRQASASSQDMHRSRVYVRLLWNTSPLGTSCNDNQYGQAHATHPSGPCTLPLGTVNRLLHPPPSRQSHIYNRRMLCCLQPPMHTTDSSSIRTRLICTVQSRKIHNRIVSLSRQQKLCRLDRRCKMLRCSLTLYTDNMYQQDSFGIVIALYYHYTFPHHNCSIGLFLRLGYIALSDSRSNWRFHH
jgi:hypothetical protein